MPIDKYKYLEVFRQGDNRKGYIYLDQSVLILALMLYFTKMRSMRTLGFGKNSLGKFMKYTYSFRKKESLLELPVRGNLCLRVHAGYLVFDIKRGSVFKVFDDSVSRTSVEKEIFWLLVCRNITFVPYLKQWDMCGQWYEVDYVNGSIGRFLYRQSREDFIKAYYEHIEPFLLQLLRAGPPKLVNAAEYAENIIASSNLDKLREIGVDETAALEIRDFLYVQLQHIQCKKDTCVYLTTSHGDLSPGNIICVKGKIMVVDWEDVDYRSALHDLFNILLRVHAGFLSRADIYGAITVMKERLFNQEPEVATSFLVETDVYRWLFYIEKTCKIMKREITEKRLGDILRSMRYFKHYEANVETKDE